MSTASVDTILVIIAPETGTKFSQPQRYAVIEIATTMVGFGCGTTKDVAIAYLSAHMLTVSGRNGVAGQVTSEKEGELARSYGSISDAAGTGFNLTSYGQEYLRMMNSNILTPITRQWVPDNGC